MSPLSRKDVETVVSRALGPDFYILNYRLQPFSKEKTGILGSHLSLIVDVKDDASNSGVKTHSFFVKTAPESQIIAESIMDRSMLEEEIHFYKVIHPQMTDNSRLERWSPKCYLVKDEVIVSEDLRVQGFSIREDSLLDDQSLKLALSALARFHASSIVLEAQLGKKLNEAYPSAFPEKMYTDKIKFGHGTKVGFDTITLIADRFGLDSSLVPKIYERIHELVRPAENRCNVVCHSDLWKNNLMFDNSESPKCVLVDYQLLRYASPAIDVGMFLFLHTTPELRRKVEHRLFEYYYSCLRDSIIQKDERVCVPSYEDMVSDYKERRLVGMGYASLYLPGIYLNPEEFVKLLNDPKLLEQWFFHDRITVIAKSLDADAVYNKKIKSIICELLEEGKRLFNE